jgi:hypothetical protein
MSLSIAPTGINARYSVCFDFTPPLRTRCPTFLTRLSKSNTYLKTLGDFFKDASHFLEDFLSFILTGFYK